MGGRAVKGEGLEGEGRIRVKGECKRRLWGRAREEVEGRQRPGSIATGGGR